MKRLIVYCEGDTEAKFVEDVLRPYMQDMNIYVEPRICETKRTPAKKYKGGVSDYNKIKRELIGFCKHDHGALFTTMFDYYGLPKNTPGIATATGSIYDKAHHIEKAIEADLGGLPNLFFNLTMHEFEGLLFSDLSAFNGIAEINAIKELQKIGNIFETPEHINNSPDTAPSKRIEKIIPGYSKKFDGIRLADCIGIDGISAKCHHFGNWIAKMVDMAKEGGQ